MGEKQETKNWNEIGTEQMSADEIRSKSGLSLGKTAFFLIAQMAGAGFLALPRAMADAGWIGLVMMTLFCVSVAFAATRLGQAWVAIEERYPEYRKPVRQPYVELASLALGPFGRKLTRACIVIGNLGSSTVFMILTSELLNSIIPQISTCEFILIAAACLAPLTWFGSPKDFWQVSVLAVFSTVLTIVIILVKIFLDFAVDPVYPLPSHPNPTIPSFSLGFGATLFSFGGMAVFPTIQNDMKDRSEFWKAVIIGFSVIFVLYLPVALFGYIYIGDVVNSNVLLSITSSPLVTVAVAFEIFNLMGTYIITLSPVFQCFEEMFGVPPHFGIKRLALRSCVILLEVLIALSFPDFGLVVNLIGGSTLSIISFIVPPLVYFKLNNKMKKENWTRSTSIPTWQRFYLWEVVVVGAVGGICSTVTSLYALLRPEQFETSCFAHFN